MKERLNTYRAFRFIILVCFLSIPFPDKFAVFAQVTVTEEYCYFGICPSEPVDRVDGSLCPVDVMGKFSGGFDYSVDIDYPKSQRSFDNMPSNSPEYWIDKQNGADNAYCQTNDECEVRVLLNATTVDNVQSEIQTSKYIDSGCAKITIFGKSATCCIEE